MAQTQIVYIAEHETGVRNLYVMDYDGFSPRRLATARNLTLMPTWLPDQRSVVYTAYRHNNQEIVQLHLASGAKHVLVPPEILNMTPAFSPDGHLIAYASAREGNSDIFTMNVQTNEKTQLTFDDSADLSPTWAPNGQELAFTSDRGGGPQIYIMSANGSNVRRLTFDGNYNAAPAWSPRGDWIAYVCHMRKTGFRLCRISPDGQRRVQITNGSGGDRARAIDDSPSWAPDGRHIVFSSARSGQSHIYMIHYDGTGLEQLTKGRRRHSAPAWSPL